MTMTRRILSMILALALALAVIPAAPVAAHAPAGALSLATSETGVVDSTACFLIKYRGSTVGKPTVEVAAGGDLTLKIATVADVTSGTAVNGIFDLSTPAAADDTMGELVNRINTQGSNWVAVLVSCLASDLTDNTLDDIAATDASSPRGVAMTREATSASATSVFSAQSALLPDDAETNIAWLLSGSPVAGPSGSTKVNRNP